jgi:PqqD family protein of HPr-rel-A system
VNFTATRFACAAGLRVELLGDSWIAYSPLSGETMMLNDESAAVLEVLREAPGDIASVCRTLAADLDADPEQLMERIAPAWSLLIDNGLVVEGCASLA